MKIKTILAGVATVAAAAFLALGVTSITSHAEDKDFWFENIKYSVTSEGQNGDPGTVKAFMCADDAKDVHIYKTVYDEAGHAYTTTAIANSTFKNNKSVKKVVISFVATENLPDNLFNGCKKLERVYVHAEKIKKIGKNCFANCPNLEYVGFMSTKITKSGIAKNSFDGVGEVTIGCKTKAKAKKYAKWIVNRGGAYDADYETWDGDDD